MIVKILLTIAIFLLTGCGLIVENAILKHNSCSHKNKSPIDYWIHSGKTPEERAQQWFACGGYFHWDFEIYKIELGLSIEEYLLGPYRDHRSKQRYTCMLDMGYSYTSWCEISSTNPTCRERSLDKFPPYR